MCRVTTYLFTNCDCEQSTELESTGCDGECTLTPASAITIRGNSVCPRHPRGTSQSSARGGDSGRREGPPAQRQGTTIHQEHPKS